MWEASLGVKVSSVDLRVGGEFSDRLRQRDAAAVVRAKKSLLDAIHLQTLDPADRLAQAHSAFAMIDSSSALLASV